MGFINTVRGFIFYIVFALLLVPLFFGTLLSIPFTSADWRYEHVCRRWVRSVTKSLKWICGVTVKNEGMENMPDRYTPVVVMSRHESAWDPFWLGEYLPAPVCFLYKRSLHWIPLFGIVLWSMQMIPVDRARGGGAFQAFIKKGPTIFNRGWWMALFPEATRVAPGQTIKFKTGGARFATQFQTPVLPIAHTAGDCWPKNSIGKRPGVIRVSVGPLIPTEGKTAKQVSDEAESWINQEVKRLRNERT